MLKSLVEHSLCRKLQFEPKANLFPQLAAFLNKQQLPTSHKTTLAAIYYNFMLKYLRWF